MHPYLVPGAGGVDDWEFELDAGLVLGVDGERLLPTGVVDVSTTDLDFRARRFLNGLAVDHAFTGLATTDRTTARVWAAEGTGVAMHWSPAELPWCRCTPPTGSTQPITGSAWPWSR